MQIMSKNPLLRYDHPPFAARQAARLTPYALVKLGLFMFGFPRNAFGSIDVTKRCNLRCSHCYFFEQDMQNKQELTIEQWVEKLEDLKKKGRSEFPFLQCTWVGGEPLIRKDLIEKGKAYFRYNTVVTNGWWPLPDWPDVNFYMSVDGTEEVHERLRNQRGLYAHMKQNANRPDLKVIGAYCITNENKHCIEETILEWRDIFRHMVFDFYTPIEGLDNDGLWITWDERDAIIDKLLELKKIYNMFFITPERTLRLMKSKHASSVTSNCLFAKHSFSFDVSGDLKEKCMMGVKADCSRCGCVVPYYMESLVNRRFVLADLWSTAQSTVAARH
ncbi:MAG: radical SAM protein [Candidatus Schekmanbacteria bacterium]|nr:radical SAM protein [Candidatus Schekmanbacteria bacterium]